MRDEYGNPDWSSEAAKVRENTAKANMQKLRDEYTAAYKAKKTKLLQEMGK